MSQPKPGVYRHFKGNHYLLLGVARHTETLEWVVVYQALYGERGLWVRPLAMWEETVEQGNAQMPRFSYVCETPDALLKLPPDNSPLT